MRRSPALILPVGSEDLSIPRVVGVGPGRGADSPGNEPHAAVTQRAVQAAGMPRLGSVRVTVLREVRLYLEHPGWREPANRPLVRAQVYSRSPDAVGVRPEAAPQDSRVAEVSARAVHFREK